VACKLRQSARCLKCSARAQAKSPAHRDVWAKTIEAFADVNRLRQHEHDRDVHFYAYTRARAGYDVWAKTIEALADIGYDSTNMIAMPYDWRLSVPNLELRDGYFTKLKMQARHPFSFYLDYLLLHVIQQEDARAALHGRALARASDTRPEWCRLRLPPARPTETRRSDCEPRLTMLR
jgi:Lecithin:cholesterol acyltransferase